MGTPDAKLIAIDVLLEPDRPMADKVKSLNAWLRENYQAGYALDATHMPHVTLLQRLCERETSMRLPPQSRRYLWPSTAMKLTIRSLDYLRFAGLAVAVLIVERTTELMWLHHRIIDAVAPFSVSGGTPAAFVGAETVAGDG